MLNITNLKTLHMNQPLGIDTEPYFSWMLESDQRDTMQENYRIQVSDESGLVWDSGKITGKESTFITYSGKKLREKTEYTWKVTVMDNHGEEAEESSKFETAILEKKSWKAKWMDTPFTMKKRKQGFGNQPAASYFRRSFSLEHKTIKKARLYVTCHGIYELFINGTAPDDRKFAPENTVYRGYLCYQTYDITDLLQEGENVIGMIVGDGWYCGSKTSPDMKNYKPIHAVLFQAEITYADGTVDTICSDRKVRVSTGEIQSNDLYAGEIYDANKKKRGWNLPGFNDASWQDAKEADYGYDTLVAQFGEPVRPVMELPCKEILNSPKGEKILDFGQVMAGMVRAVIRAPKGTQVTFEHSEVLDKDGNYYNNILLGGVDQKIVYISDGTEEEFEPHFSFQGFRYVKVSGLDNVRAEDFKAIVYTSEKEDIGTFSCSDPMVNQLYSNIRWSQRSNLLSIPTDCPQREKAGWTGDAQIFVKTAMLNEDTTTFYTRWLQNLSIEQKDSGAVPMVVPMHGIYIPAFKLFGMLFHNEDCVAASSGWSDAAVIVPFRMYQITGNKEILKQQYGSMKKWCDYMIRASKTKHKKIKGLSRQYEQYLWNTGFHWGEWLIPSFSKNGYGLDTVKSVLETRKYTAPLYAYYSISRMADTAEILGIQDDQAYYRRAADNIKEAFHAWIRANKGEMPMRIMGAYVLPIHYDLVPEEYRQHFADELVKILEENDYCLDTGFLGTPCLFDVLCKIGRQDLAFKVFYQDREPSFMSEIKQGATSIWESWFVYDKNGNPMKVSLNHYAFGCVADWMYRTINGIEEDQAGFRHFKVCPQIDGHLTYAHRDYKSEYGWICSDWSLEDKHFMLHVKVPCNTSATVILPDGEQHEVGSGSYDFSCILDKLPVE